MLRGRRAEHGGADQGAGKGERGEVHSSTPQNMIGRQSRGWCLRKNVGFAWPRKRFEFVMCYCSTTGARAMLHCCERPLTTDAVAAPKAKAITATRPAPPHPCRNYSAQPRAPDAYLGPTPGARSGRAQHPGTHGRRVGGDREGAAALPGVAISARPSVAYR